MATLPSSAPEQNIVHGLRQVDSTEQIGEWLLEGVTRTIENPTSIVYQFDREDAILRPIAATRGTAGTFEELRPIDGDSEVWAAFLTGEAAVVDGSDALAAQTNGDLGIDRTFVAPISGFGALVLVPPPGEEVPQHVREVIVTLADLGLLAFERLVYQYRAESAYSADAHSKIGARRRLAIFLHLLEHVFESEAETQLGTAVCQQLAEIESVAHAALWTERGREHWSLPDTQAGGITAYFEEVTARSRSDGEPSLVTAETGELVCVDDVAIGVEDEPWRRVALDHGVTAVLSVPLRTRGVQFGVLSVYLDEPVPIDDHVVEEAITGGELVAHGLATIDQRHALAAGHGTEIELRTTDEACLNLRLARETGCSLEFVSAAPTAEGALVYVNVDEGRADDFIDVAERSLVVVSTRHLAGAADDAFVEARLTERPLELDLVTLGANPTSVTATDEAATALARVPQARETRSVVERLESRYEDVEITAQRTTRFDPRTTDAATLLAGLTDRQRELIEAAYREGYFDSPREHSGDEIADGFGMAPSTFYEHVRAAQRNLCAALFDEGESDDRGRRVG